MSRNWKRIILLDVVALCLFSVISFVLPSERNATFWLSFGFGMLAILAQFYVQYSYFDKAATVRSIYFGFPVIYIGLIYAVIQTILSVVFMALSEILSVSITIIPCVLILTLAIIGFVSVNVMREEISRQENKLEKDVSIMNTLKLKMYQLTEKCEDITARKAMEKLSDSFKYSDPVGGDYLKPYEESLVRAVVKLEDAITESNVQEILSLCKEVSGLLAVRNRICKANKNK